MRHAATRSTRSFAFPTDEPLDDRGRADAIALAGVVPSRHETLASPSLRCRQTAEAAGLTIDAFDEALAECDFGLWGGRTLDDVADDDAEAVRAWMTDPDAQPHGGESLRTFVARVGRWLDVQAQLDGSAVVLTHGGVAKAAVIHALDAPVAAFWRVDVAPLSITEIHAHDGRWTLTRTNARIGADGAREVVA